MDYALSPSANREDSVGGRFRLRHHRNGAYRFQLRDGGEPCHAGARGGRRAGGASARHRSEERTYFARAYFEEQLESTHDLVAAFEAARERLASWEESEDKTPSQPQMALGDAMASKLETLTARLDTL